MSLPDDRFEVQDADERGFLAWFSADPGCYDPVDMAKVESLLMSKEAAILVAEARPLPDGWSRKVRHVGTGEVVWEGKG